MIVIVGNECGIGLKHALACAPVLWRRCKINRELTKKVALDLGLDPTQTKGAVRLLRSTVNLPSPERLALVVMRDPGLEDADIAEMFGRSERWVRAVKSRMADLREAEPLDESLEYLDAGLQPGDPTPEEIQDRVIELHATGRFRGWSPDATPWSIPCMERRNNAFVRVRAK